MKIHLECNGFALNSATKTYIERKVGALSKPLKRFEANGELMAWVEVGRTTHHHKKGEVFRAAINIIGLPGRIFRAENRDVSLLAAVDGVKNRIWDDLGKYKDRIVTGTKHSYRWIGRTFKIGE